MKKVIFPLLLAGFFACVSGQQKNVLFLMADDFNYWLNEIGYYPEVHTPNLDSLARTGVLFTDAHCSSPVCNPSRNALWSGYRPSTTGISRNSDGYVREKDGFEDIITMNQYFTGHGYHTYAVGKLYHPGRMDASNPDCDPLNWSELNQQGSGCNGGSLYEYQCGGWTSLKFSANASPVSRENCSDYDMAHNVADFISSYDPADHNGMPFFLGCGFFRPHLPWNSPVDFWNLLDYEALVVPPGVKEGEKAGSAQEALLADNMWMRAIQAYLGSMALADANVGIVMEALRNSVHKDNTIVLFMGDHGWHLGEKGHWGKFTTWDEANHTTLIIWDPSAEGNGQKCHHVVSLQDLYPTLVELCGLPEKKDIEGRSIAGLLDEPADSTWNWPILMTYADMDYIKSNDWRFLEDGDDSRLYNMRTDPYEWNNLYGQSQYEEVVSVLRSRMDSIKKIGFEIRDSLRANSHVPEVQNIPGRIEAESYADMSGIQKEGCSDEGGGENIAFINSGDWSSYAVMVREAGRYNLAFRVASGTSGGTIRVYNLNTLLGSVQVEGTGGWQIWTTDSLEVDLKAGPAILKLEYSGPASGYLMNINYVQAELLRGLGMDSRVSDRKVLLSNVTVKNQLLLDLTYTNPVARVEIYDLNGKVLQTEYVAGEQEVTISLDSCMNPGMFIVRVDDREIVYTETFMHVP